MILFIIIIAIFIAIMFIYVFFISKHNHNKKDDFKILLQENHNGVIYVLFEHDGCEYISLSNRAMIHKFNCKNKLHIKEGNNHNENELFNGRRN